MATTVVSTSLHVTSVLFSHKQQKGCHIYRRLWQVTTSLHMTSLSLPSATELIPLNMTSHFVASPLTGDASGSALVVRTSLYVTSQSVLSSPPDKIMADTWGKYVITLPLSRSEARDPANSPRHDGSDLQQ